jgi:lipoyl(octanoyl) transferase
VRSLRTSWLGRVGYAEAFTLQQRIASAVAGGVSPDTLLLLEHDAVYTLGRRAAESDVLLDERALAQRGIAVERTDRGGRVTYHGPGQLVGYPIVNLGAAADVKAYVCELQRVIISVCSSFGVTAETDPEHVGVWVGDAKIGAIGIHVSRGVTTHGFAFNVAPDLSAFNGIVPCGIVDRGVTSLAALGVDPVPSVADVALLVASDLAPRLDRALSIVEPGSLIEGVHV